MSTMQNYAKFDSRIVEESAIQSNNYWWYYNDSYNWVDIFNSFWSFINDLIWLLMTFITIIWVIFWFFFFLYIIISLFTKWWEKTSIELKNFLESLLKNTVKFIKFCFEKISQFTKFLFRKKFISFIIILIIFLLNFLWNIVDWKSRVLKLTKIETWYVWVDLKNMEILTPGYHFYSPIKTNFFLSPTNNFDFEIAEVTANTSEELWVILDYRVWFKIIDEKRLEFYKKYWAKDIKLVSSDIVMPRLLESIKWIIKSYSFKEISSKHNEIKNKTIDEANKILKNIWIELQEINILDIRLPQTYLKSKEDLLNAENEFKLAEAKLETQKKESEKKVLEAENLKKVKIIEAEWIAESNKIINSQEITDKMLQMKELENEELKIQKWDWKLPTTTWKEFDFLK